MKKITSKSNPQITSLKLIRDGKEKDYFFCEGEKLVKELFKTNYSIKSIYCIPSTRSEAEKLIQKNNKPHISLYELPDSVMNSVSDLESPPGLIALAKKKDQIEKKEYIQKSPLYLILHEIQLPQNLGPILRSCEAIGVTETWLTKNTCDPLSPKVLRGSMGSALRVPLKMGLTWENALKSLKNMGVNILVATQQATDPYFEYDWTQPTALIVGSEGRGFSSKDLELADGTIQIPMVGRVESLNVGTAVAVCLFEAARQRQSKGL